MAFKRRWEPNEQAFSLHVPQGWLIEGGIHRANLMQQVVDAQSIQAKLDFSVKKDPAGTVMMRLCPEIKYCDMRFSPAGMMGMFMPGSNVSGMVSAPLMGAADFLAQFAFPWAHPAAQGAQVVEAKREEQLVVNYKRKMASLGTPTNFQYDGAVVLFRYTEDGVRYEEAGFTVIENLGRLGGGMWSNKDTALFRAPEGELESWRPVFTTILESVQLNHQWLSHEIVSQEFLSRSFLNAQQAQMARDRRMLEIQRQVQDIDRQIVEHRQRTNAEIMNDNYLTLMELEEYVNPYTNEPELGSNQWQHRWVTEGGDVFYSDDSWDDPNVPGLLNASDWKRTPVRPRFPQ